MRIAFAGTPAFALPALHALAASPHRLVGVLTQPDRPSGRGRRIKPSPVKLVAREYGLPVAQPQTLRTQEERAELESWRPDLLVVVAYGLILPPAALGLPRLGCLNIHPSLLPRWRGAAPIQRAILAGDTVTGVTIMQMDAGLDTGPILAQRSAPIDRTMTSGSLHDLLAALGAEALLGTLADLAAGAASPRAQPAEGVTYAAKIGKSEAPIDWRSSALEIERQVRAFDPRPAAETRLGEEPLRILAAHALEGDCTGRPSAAHTIPAPAGTIIAVGPDAIVVSCGEGRLAITKLQRAGRKPLSAREFANAGRLAPGQSLG
ncbi:MAG: methionyl-tRNA formyltransferase [Steroidobacteraceae bacterium]